MIDELRCHRVDLVCLAGDTCASSAGILSGGFSMRRGILNIHPARCCAPFLGSTRSIRLLEHGVKFSGCTVDFVDEGFRDWGPSSGQALFGVRC